MVIRWWRFDEADSYAGTVVLDTADGDSTGFDSPADAQPGNTIHVIAEATDDGSPALTRDERFVVTVTP